MAELIKDLLGVETVGDPRSTVSDESPDYVHGLDRAFTKLLWPTVNPCYW